MKQSFLFIFMYTTTATAAITTTAAAITETRIVVKLDPVEGVGAAEVVGSVDLDVVADENVPDVESG